MAEKEKLTIVVFSGDLDRALAAFILASARCGISAKQIQREMGVTYKTAWRMFHQIFLYNA